MESKKLNHILSILSENLSQKQIPFCLIGAMALGIYGLPRYTSDIDLLTELRHWPDIYSIMEKLGYECFQKTDMFAQFDSELGVYGKVDFMFVSTRDGKDILMRSISIEDEIFGNIPVIQPSDYVILKLMAIANNPDRSVKDESDLSGFFDLHQKNLLATYFDPLDVDKIMLFADRFGQRRLIEKYRKHIEFSTKRPQHL
jgi:predicted nucleotidyltransferase